jgi:predicted permease
MREGWSWRRLVQVFRRDPRDEIEDELSFHLEQRVRDGLARGLDRESARRAALARMGDVERARAECAALLSAERRAHDRRVRLNVSWLEVKLGVRMLVKYPGLTLVGGLGMAVAVAIGAGFFDVAAVVDATLPFEDGDRIVAIENWDTEWNDPERRILHDFVLWRDELASVADLGAYRTVGRNLIVPGGETVLVYPAEMTASGFTVTRVPALLGRTLLPEDERAVAPPVVVIGYDLWRTRFASDPGVVGREIRLGSAVHTVVGVMPEGFAFPLSDQLWIPLRANPTEHARRQGPGMQVFGRLAEGATLESAQAELTAIALRMASAFPQTHERLRPRVMPYARQIYDDMEGWEIYVVQVLILLLLVVVCVNVAILVYARTATRQAEITVRTALGGSRRRIVGQLFAEALVFSTVSAMVGLVLARVVLRFVDDALATLVPAMPFWIEFELSAGTVVYVAALTILSALIVGVLPALQATGRRVQARLQYRGAGALHLGTTWTVLVILQVAITVAVLPGAAYHAWQFVRFGTADPGYRTEEFLAARLSLEGSTNTSDAADVIDPDFDARFAVLQSALVARLRTEPAVSDVVLTMGPPGEEGTILLEVEGVPIASGTGEAVREAGNGFRVATSSVAADFFDGFDVPLLAGRTFDGADAIDGATTVVVNRSFVDEVLRGGNALGRRVRHVARGGSADAAETRPWFEIVGVVADFPNPIDPGVAAAKVYWPAGRDVPYDMVNVRVRDANPMAFARRLRDVAAGLDPRLQLRALEPLDVVIREEQRSMQLGALGIAAVTSSVLLLSAAGIYAMMSFAVTRRRREIGIRAALGAHPRWLLTTIFSRALGQLAVGVVVGLLLSAWLDMATEGELMGGERSLLLPAVSVFMVVVGLLAAFGPARRALSVQPTEALRGE